MSCDRYKAFQLGRMDKASFREHAKTCAACRRALTEDERIMSGARALRTPVEAEGLWERIQAGLIKETVRRPMLFRRYALISAVALLMLSVGLTSWLLFSRSRGLLSPASLALIEKRESAYLEAISRLDTSAEAQLETLDVSLMLLYRERLRTIEEQIDQCREALASNPANAHIRRYLFSALKEKRETLTELLQNPGTAKRERDLI